VLTYQVNAPRAKYGWREKQKEKARLPPAGSQTKKKGREGGKEGGRAYLPGECTTCKICVA